MIEQTIRQYYPQAVNSHEFVLKVYDIMCSSYRVSPTDILLAHSICSDDVNNIEYPEEGRQMLGPFNLGGLDGFPFAGLTGLGAFAKHVPDTGAALVFYGPHIGISEDGTVGKILRTGQHTLSACCGAAALALSRLEQNTAFAGGAERNPLDYQQQTLEEIVSANKDRILRAENRLIETTEAIYEASERAVDQLIAQTDFTGEYVFVIGAIIINSDWQHGSFIETRRFDCLNSKTKEKVREHSIDN